MWRAHVLLFGLWSLALPWFSTSGNAVAADQARLAARIATPADHLAVLAQQVAESGPALQWDFANITLDVLLDAYRRELSDAWDERLTDPKRRAKLARWRQATADLAARLEGSRLRLLDGAAFSVFVDPQRQTLILVDGQPIAVDAAHPEAEAWISEQVISRYCAYNDCSALDAVLNTSRAATQPGSGGWLLQQHASPAFQATDDIHCQFTDIVHRTDKADTCRGMAAEILDLSDAITLAHSDGYRVDWQHIEHAQPSHSDSGRVMINTDSAYLRLSTRLLSQMDPDDWRRVVDWLHDAEERQILVIRHAPQAAGVKYFGD